MKFRYGKELAVALLCAISGAACTQIQPGAATVIHASETRVRAERLEHEHRAAAIDAYMVYLHSNAINSAGGLLPSRPFPADMETHLGAATDVDTDAGAMRTGVNGNVGSGVSGAMQ